MLNKKVLDSDRTGIGQRFSFYPVNGSDSGIGKAERA